MDHKLFAQKMHKYSLLYVEDDTEVREHLEEFLNYYFKKVYTCYSAEEGLKIYEEYQPDIVLLDINLTGMSGVELATLIRETDKKTRIVISTAYTNKEFMLQAIELELTRYLVKPLTNEDLVRALEKCRDELSGKESIDLAHGCTYNSKMAVIINNGKKTFLRNKEVKILEYFIAHEGEVIRYERLEEDIWGDEIMSRDTIRSQIRNIRKKLEIDLFENVNGLGYKFTRRYLV